MSNQDAIAREHRMARDVIANALTDWFPGSVGGMDGAYQYAEAILARLASHKPPLLVEVYEEGDGK
jgi:hypothetical protein